MYGLALPDDIDAEAAALRLAADAGLCWLDGERAHRDGRYAFVASEPVERVTVRWGEPQPLAVLARLEVGAGEVDCGLAGAPAASVVPRWIGYIAYDACLSGIGKGDAHAHAHGDVNGNVDVDVAVRVRVRLADRGRTPVVDFARYDAVAAFDLIERRGFVLGDDREACERLYTRLMRAPAALPPTRLHDATFRPAHEHLTAIERALEHIARGDVYQVNLARELRAKLHGSPLALYRALRHASPVPLGMYYDDGERVITARTMERFLRWDRTTRALSTRPIKGTLARDADDARDADNARDAGLAATLTADPKERAEHAMIVDLMRNDLSRVAELGTVHLPGLFEVEPFARLMHLVSTVACTTRPEVGLCDVVEATFPPGSVTGAPKLAAVALIEALEAVPRGVYTGGLGLVDRTGGLSLAVAIRTAVIEGQQVRYFAGGGIVEASQPQRELRETELKARVLLDAGEWLEATQPAGSNENLGTRPFLR